jgi:hypothetical protein
MNPANPNDEILALLVSLKADPCNSFYIQTIGSVCKITFYESFKDRKDIFPKACICMGREIMRHFVDVASVVLQQTEQEVNNPEHLKQSDLDKMN